MANRFVRRARDSGDRGQWADFQHAQDYLGLPTLTTYLYNDGGALKLSKGIVGLDDDSDIGNCIFDTITSLIITSLTNSLWARVEVAKINTSISIYLTSIAGANDVNALPASFINGYDAEKCGYYIQSDRRVLGLVWINASGNIGDIVNCQYAYNYVRGASLQPGLPAGAVQMFGGSTAPTGWLLCNGAAISRTTYAALFSAIGTTFGVGDGSTTFNLPDFGGIFPRGAGAANTQLDNAQGNPFAGTLGEYQNDKMQGHWHGSGLRVNPTSGYIVNTTQACANGAARVDSQGTASTDEVVGTEPVDDTVNGTPRTGAETNPANLAVNFIIKY